uniref:Uncharacterized protein n=1 Tax=Corvus moneduloides TaxID=1196302 RepID=A0A8C3DUA4_CORMO
MLEISIFELRNTVTELEKSVNSVEKEDNEWKTRYETQVELNKQLERQINILRDKVELIRRNPADKLFIVRTFDKMPVGSLKEVLKHLEEEKRSLQNQLKDYELRLEQEAKAYHKANDERRMYLSEILQISAKLKIVERQKPDALTGKGEKQILRQKAPFQLLKAVFLAWRNRGIAFWDYLLLSPLPVASCLVGSDCTAHLEEMCIPWENLKLVPDKPQKSATP